MLSQSLLFLSAVIISIGISTCDTGCDGNCTDIESKASNRHALDTSLTLLSRKRRYVAFPEGSSFSIAYCMTIGMIGTPQFSYLSWSINFGVAYDLPNQTWILNNSNRKPLMPKPVVLRRHRRDLYSRLEAVINNMGYNGRQCILRALCESSQYFYKEKSNLASEMIKTIFSLPKTKVLPFEHNDLLEYDSAHRKGRQRAYCPRAYPKCSISLIKMALGEYSKPIM